MVSVNARSACAAANVVVASATFGVDHVANATSLALLAKAAATPAFYACFTASACQACFCLWATAYVAAS